VRGELGHSIPHDGVPDRRGGLRIGLPILPSPACTREMREHVWGSLIRRSQLAFCLRVCYCHRGLLARRGRSAHRGQLPTWGFDTDQRC
jgi:hypothetical protein